MIYADNVDERKRILERLIALEEPLKPIQEALIKFKWDSEELVYLSPNHIADILRRYLDGVLSAHVVEDWANTVELRDDIGFQAPHESLVREVVYQLASPLLTRPLNFLKAQKLLGRIESALRE